MIHAYPTSLFFVYIIPFVLSHVLFMQIYMQFYRLDMSEIDCMPCAPTYTSPSLYQQGIDWTYGSW